MSNRRINTLTSLIVFVLAVWSPAQGSDLGSGVAETCSNFSSGITSPTVELFPIPSASATCTAQCGYGFSPPVSCSGSQCSAQDSACDFGTRGYVQCGSTRIYCESCAVAPVCEEEAVRHRMVVGECCGGLQKWDRDECIDGQWQFVQKDCFDQCGGPLY